MKIANINYKGRVTCPLSKLNFPSSMKPPQMLTFECEQKGVKLLIFKTGKCRLMGCKEPVTKPIKCVVPYILTNLMSITLTMNVGYKVNLYKMATALGSKKCMYEPELFPAARLLQFNPVCVNVFQSGKVVILGQKSMTYNKLSSTISEILHCYKFC